jgi:hypothetical protein
LLSTGKRITQRSEIRGFPLAKFLERRRHEVRSGPAPGALLFLIAQESVDDVASLWFIIHQAASSRQESVVH